MVTDMLTPVLRHTALQFGYQDPRIEITFSTLVQTTRLLSFSPLIAFPLYILALSVIFNFYGLLLEFTQIGNRRDIAIIDEMKCLDYKMWNRKLLLQKETWAAFFISFSPTRNTFLTLGQSRPNKQVITSYKSKKTIDNMIVLEGIRGLCIIIMCFGLTFELSQFSILSNTAYRGHLENNFLFNEFLAIGSYNAIEIFFFLAGMSQAVSLLQQTHDNPSFYHVVAFTFKRVLKIWFFYSLNILLMVYMFRHLGRGPLWHFWDKIMENCDHSLLPNILFHMNLTQPEDK